jgi:hypothetical protein
VNSRLLIFVAVALLGLGLFVIREKEEANLGNETSGQEVQPSPSQTAAIGTDHEVSSDSLPKASAKSVPNAAPAPSSRPVISKATDLREQTPSLEQVRNEVAANPHKTPMSVIEFSVALGEKMRAVQNETQATELFRELEDCTLDRPENKTKSVRALCLARARRLSDRYDSLRTSYSTLVSRSDKDVVHISKSVK